MTHLGSVCPIRAALTALGMPGAASMLHLSVTNTCRMSLRVRPHSLRGLAAAAYRA